MYCVYEHWYKGKCFYVGSGSLTRPFDIRKKSRNSDWLNYFNGDSENLQINIIDDNLSYEESCKLEDEITIKRIKENQPLTNKIIGRHSAHSEITKDKISKSLSGENHPYYGKKRSEDFRNKIGKALSIKTILEIDDKKIEFESRKECIEYCKLNNICSRNSVIRSINGEIPKFFKSKNIKIYYKKERGN